jgi:hypothetical protein
VDASHGVNAPFGAVSENRSRSENTARGVFAPWSRKGLAGQDGGQEQAPMTNTQSNVIRLKSETWQKAVEVADGFWIVATRHRPGFLKMQPVVNNRCLIFRLRDQERQEDVLLVSNGVDPEVIPEVKAIER